MLQQHHPDSTASSRRRVGLLVLALLVVASAIVPASAAATAASTDTHAQPTVATDAPALQDNETAPDDGNGSASNETENDTSPVSDASQVRVTPDVPGEDYVSIRVAEPDEVFNTSGGFATFSLSRPVESARITQDKASVAVLGGGSVVRVSYADDAAPRNSTSLYTLELYFEDGSQKTVELYATNTAVSASTAIDPKWQGVIDWITTEAEDAGYGTAPSDVQAWVEDTQERAQIFENFWSRYIKEYVTLKIAQVMNPIQWVELIGIIALISIYWSRKYGWILTLQQLSMPISKLQREAARQAYEKSRKAAAQHKISDISEIGTNAARYWRSEMGVETVDDMVEIAVKGIVAKDENGDVLFDDNGDVVYAHHGVEDLMQVDPVTHRTLRKHTWLRPLLVDPRLNAATALANIERALRVAEKEYKRGNEVRKTRMQVEELIEELSDSRTGTQSPSSTPFNTGSGVGTTAGTSTPAGGD
jgi:PAS domain-containing protein